MPNLPLSSYDRSPVTPSRSVYRSCGAVRNKSRSTLIANSPLPLAGILNDAVVSPLAKRCRLSTTPYLTELIGNGNGFGLLTSKPSTNVCFEKSTLRTSTFLRLTLGLPILEATVAQPPSKDSRAISNKAISRRRHHPLAVVLGTTLSHILAVVT